LNDIIYLTDSSDLLGRGLHRMPHQVAGDEGIISRHNQRLSDRYETSQMRIKP
jgi:hypothetical protein